MSVALASQADPLELVAHLNARRPKLRGRLLANPSLAELTWFRVGGAAQALFMPEDEADLAYALAELAPEIPVTVIGLGSNLIVRDGGVPGVVVRLGRGFGEVRVEAGGRIRAGAAVPDVKVGRAAQEAGLAGLAFFRGIPGAIGGALRMNGGAYGRETKDTLIEARGVDRQGRVRVFANMDMGFCYRHCGARGSGHEQACCRLDGRLVGRARNFAALRQSVRRGACAARLSRDPHRRGPRHSHRAHHREAGRGPQCAARATR